MLVWILDPNIAKNFDKTRFQGTASLLGFKLVVHGKLKGFCMFVPLLLQPTVAITMHVWSPSLVFSL